MSDIAIRVENLSKRYRIGEKQKQYTTLRDLVVGQARRFTQRHSHTGADAEDFWALKDVSFEVKQGEIVGVIGRNGAGKSTLLKILSRITEPTEGSVDLHGRVGSLLEVGTGFHPELTGRENIFLNGAILGMKRVEIQRRFDEIVDFSEIEQFLDTPVKHYSSGMHVRLAFAVAAHLEPEILLVDEVLAVGDAQFQQKCLGKMEGLGRAGRTVLFVSHSMPAITRLCEKAVWLHKGEVKQAGHCLDVVGAYLRLGTQTSSERIWQKEDAPGDQHARLHAVRVLSQERVVSSSFQIDEPVRIEVQYWDLQGLFKTCAIIHLINEDGTCLLASNAWNNREWWNTPRSPALVKATCIVPGNFLAEGNYYVLAAVGSYNPNIVHALERDVVSFHIADRTNGEGVRGPYSGDRWPGVVRPMLDWSVLTEKLPVM